MDGLWVLSIGGGLWRRDARGELWGKSMSECERGVTAPGTSADASHQLYPTASVIESTSCVPSRSGARLGVATEIRDNLCVAWVDDDDPTKGFR